NGVALLLDDLGDDLGRDRLDISRIREIGIGHDRRRIGVHQHDPIAFGLERLDRLRPGIIELAGLTDDDRPSADDEDRGDVGPLGHVARRYMYAGHKKRARSLRVLRAAQRFASPRAGRCLDQNRRSGKGAAGLLNNIKRPSSFRRVFCARVLLFGFAYPDGGVAERRETYGCLRGIRWACTIGQARHLARRLASPYGGRPPPGARTVAILGAGAALPLTGIAAGSVTANSSHPGRSARRGAPASRGDSCEPSPRDATPGSVLRIVSRARPLLSQAENLCSNVANRSQVLNARSAG